MQGDLDDFASKFPDRLKVYYVLSQVISVHIDFHLTTIYYYCCSYFLGIDCHYTLRIFLAASWSMDRWWWSCIQRNDSKSLPTSCPRHPGHFYFFNYLSLSIYIYIYIYIYSKMLCPGWKQFSNWATTIKYSSNYRYWGAGHRAWTRPWQLILMHLGTHPPCNLSSNLSLRILSSFLVSSRRLAMQSGTT